MLFGFVECMYFRQNTSQFEFLAHFSFISVEDLTKINDFSPVTQRTCFTGIPQLISSGHSVNLCVSKSSHGPFHPDITVVVDWA